MTIHDGLKEELEIPDVVSIRDQIVKIFWNKNNVEEVTLAEKKFKEYTRQGWLAYTITVNNEKIQIFDFDPTLEKIFLIPLAAGG